MPVTPEIKPSIQERPKEFNVPKELQSELKALEATPQIKIQTDKEGQPVITPQDSQSVKIQLPSDEKSLWQIAKRSINDAITWLARFLIRKKDKEEKGEALLQAGED